MSLIYASTHVPFVHIYVTSEQRDRLVSRSFVEVNCAAATASRWRKTGYEIHLARTAPFRRNRAARTCAPVLLKIDFQLDLLNWLSLVGKSLSVFAHLCACVYVRFIYRFKKYTRAFVSVLHSPSSSLCYTTKPFSKIRIISSGLTLFG